MGCSGSACSGKANTANCHRLSLKKLAFSLCFFILLFWVSVNAFHFSFVASSNIARGSPLADNWSTLFNTEMSVVTTKLGEKFDAKRADFGPFDINVASSPLAVAPLNGCTPFEDDYSGKVVMVQRGGCTFHTKVLNAQEAGAVGVIVGDNRVSDTLLYMVKADEPETITIPAFFVSKIAYRSLMSVDTVSIDNIVGGVSSDMTPLECRAFFLVFVLPWCIGTILGLLVRKSRARSAARKETDTEAIEDTQDCAPVAKDGAEPPQYSDETSQPLLDEKV